MAQRSIFAFDDDDDQYAGEGFQSAMPAEIADSKVPETGDPEGTSLEPDEQPEPETEAKPAPTPEPPPKPDPLDDWRKQSQEQFDFLRDQMIRVNQELEQTKRQLEDATRKPAEKPTDDDWVNDPTAAAERLVQMRLAEEEGKRVAHHQERFKQAQAASVQKLIDVAPIFQTDKALQADLNREFYSNPELMRDPDGPFKAAQAVARRHYKPPTTTAPQPDVQPQPADTQTVEDRAAQAERNRAAMTKKNVMHGGGKSRAKVTSVDPALAAMARKHGVSIDTIKRMEGIE